MSLFLLFSIISSSILASDFLEFNAETTVDEIIIAFHIELNFILFNLILFFCQGYTNFFFDRKKLEFFKMKWPNVAQNGLMILNSFETTY